MQKFITLFILILFTQLSYSADTKPYQISVIVFMHQPTEMILNENNPTFKKENAILLKEKNKNIKHYQKLPIQSSLLEREYYTLRKKSQYQILYHYSWLQPIKNKKTILLPVVNNNNVKIEGVLHVHKSNYYVLNTNLVITTADNKQFTFKKNERIKRNTTYYLDHPQMGMIIKIA